MEVTILDSTTAVPGRVLLLLPQPFFEDRGTSIAIHHYLEALSALGQPVDVLCFEPGRDIELPGVRTFRAANPFGFRHVPIGLSGRKLLLDASLLRRFRHHLRREDYLYVHAVEEAVVMATAFGGRRRPFVVYDMQSSLPEQLLQYRGLGNRPVQSIASRVEDWVLRRADLVVCSGGLEDRVRERAPETPVFEWRFPASAETVPADAVERLRGTLGIPPEGRIILYVGSFARYQGVPMLAEAIPRVLEAVPNTWFLAVGATDPAEIARLERAIASHVRDRVRVLARIDRTRVSAHMALAEVLLLPRIHGSNLSLKTFDYLAAGKPIVASDFPMHAWLGRKRLAYLAHVEPAAYADAVRLVLEDAGLAERLGRAARRYAEQNLQRSQFTDLVSRLLREVRKRSGLASSQVAEG